GAFRDLQRHRMLTIQWQRLTPDLGAEVPEEVSEAGCGDDYQRALEISRNEYERLRSAGLDAATPYAVCLAFRIRYILDLNAREAMQLIELRSGREGHPSYAHRLGRAYGPDSSRAALARTLRRPIDGLETDCCLTQDGDIVLLHDPLLHLDTTISGWAREHTAAEICAGQLRDWAGHPT